MSKKSIIILSICIVIMLIIVAINFIFVGRYNNFLTSPYEGVANTVSNGGLYHTMQVVPEVNWEWEEMEFSATDVSHGEKRFFATCNDVQYYTVITQKSEQKTIQKNLFQKVEGELYYYEIAVYKAEWSLIRHEETNEPLDYNISRDKELLKRVRLDINPKGEITCENILPL